MEDNHHESRPSHPWAQSNGCLWYSPAVFSMPFVLHYPPIRSTQLPCYLATVITERDGNQISLKPLYFYFSGSARWLITFLQCFHNVLPTLQPMPSRFQCLPSNNLRSDGTGDLSRLLLMEMYCLCDELWGVHHTADFLPSFFSSPLLVSAQTVAAPDV